MVKEFIHKDVLSGAKTTTVINGENVSVVQTPPTNFAQGSNSSSTTSSSSHDAVNTVNGIVTHEEHTTTGPTTTVSGDAEQPADQQG